MASKKKIGGPRKFNLPAGYRCNHLTVIKEVEGRRFNGVTKRIKRQYLCQCDCGERVIVLLERLLNKKAISCGCISGRSFRNREKYICNICGKTFDNLTSLKAHIAAFHSDIGYEYVCTSCHKKFRAKRGFKVGRLVRCPECRRKVVHAHEKVESLLQMSKRTVTKVLKRAHAKCVMCGWHKATCDVHHIIPRKDGGGDENTNLVILCPNCHREVHDGVADFTDDDMRVKSVATQWELLMSAYHPCN